MYYEDYSLGHMKTGVGNVDLSTPVDSDPKNLPPASPTILPHDDLEMMRNALQNLALVYSRNELAVNTILQALPILPMVIPRNDVIEIAPRDRPTIWPQNGAVTDVSLVMPAVWSDNLGVVHNTEINTDGVHDGLSDIGQALPMQEVDHFTMRIIGNLRSIGCDITNDQSQQITEALRQNVSNLNELLVQTVEQVIMGLSRIGFLMTVKQVLHMMHDIFHFQKAGLDVDVDEAELILQLMMQKKLYEIVDHQIQLRLHLVLQLTVHLPRYGLNVDSNQIQFMMQFMARFMTQPMLQEIIIPWTCPSILVMQERYTSNSSKLGNGSPSVRFRADGHGWVSLAGLLNGATHLENGNETPDLGVGMKITLRFKVVRSNGELHDVKKSIPSRRSTSIGESVRLIKIACHVAKTVEADMAQNGQWELGGGIPIRFEQLVMLGLVRVSKGSYQPVLAI